MARPLPWNFAVLRRASLAATVVLTATGLMAGGEYDSFHIGPIIGASASISKEYRGYMAPLPDKSGDLVAINGKGLLAPSIGVGMAWSVIPGRFRLGLDVEFMRPLDKDNSEGILTTPLKVEIPGHVLQTKVAQNVYRVTLKAIIPFQTNTKSGWYVWVGPSIAKVDTTVQVSLDGLLEDLPAKHSNLRGGGVGIGRRKIFEGSLGIFETNLHYLKDTPDGIQAGGVTFEIKGGFTF